jgi:hypothetical protein
MDQLLNEKVSRLRLHCDRLSMKLVKDQRRYLINTKNRTAPMRPRFESSRWQIYRALRTRRFAGRYPHLKKPK